MQKKCRCITKHLYGMTTGTPKAADRGLDNSFRSRGGAGQGCWRQNQVLCCSEDLNPKVTCSGMGEWRVLSWKMGECWSVMWWCSVWDPGQVPGKLLTAHLVLDCNSRWLYCTVTKIITDRGLGWFGLKGVGIGGNRAHRC